jgi:hypothetical protein
MTQQEHNALHSMRGKGYFIGNDGVRSSILRGGTILPISPSTPIGRSGIEDKRRLLMQAGASHAGVKPPAGAR